MWNPFKKKVKKLTRVTPIYYDRSRHYTYHYVEITTDLYYGICGRARLRYLVINTTSTHPLKITSEVLHWGTSTKVTDSQYWLMMEAVHGRRVHTETKGRKVIIEDLCR